MKYLVRPGSYEEDYIGLLDSAIEPLKIGKKGIEVGKIFAMECDGELIAAFDIEEPEEHVCCAGCVFKKGLEKHLRTVLDMIGTFVRENKYEVIYVKCIDGWKVGESFLTHLGFVPQKVVEKDPLLGVQLRLYKRTV